jgi:hypothetical protein
MWLALCLVIGTLVGMATLPVRPASYPSLPLQPTVLPNYFQSSFRHVTVIPDGDLKDNETRHMDNFTLTSVLADYRTVSGHSLGTGTKILSVNLPRYRNRLLLVVTYF